MWTSRTEQTPFISTQLSTNEGNSQQAFCKRNEISYQVDQIDFARFWYYFDLNFLLFLRRWTHTWVWRLRSWIKIIGMTTVWDHVCGAWARGPTHSAAQPREAASRSSTPSPVIGTWPEADATSTNQLRNATRILGGTCKIRSIHYFFFFEMRWTRHTVTLFGFQF